MCVIAPKNWVIIFRITTTTQQILQLMLIYRIGLAVIKCQYSGPQTLYHTVMWIFALCTKHAHTKSILCHDLLPHVIQNVYD